MFKLQQEEWTVDAEAVVARRVQLSSVARRTRSSRQHFFQLSLLEASRLELAAEESFTSLVLDIKGRKRAQRTELVQNLSEDSAPVEPKKKKKARNKSKKKKKNR